MSVWEIAISDIEPKTDKVIKQFKKDYPKYAKMVDDRINDLFNFPDLFWASALVGDHRMLPNLSLTTSRSTWLEKPIAFNTWSL